MNINFAKQTKRGQNVSSMASQLAQFQMKSIKGKLPVAGYLGVLRLLGSTCKRIEFIWYIKLLRVFNKSTKEDVRVLRCMCVCVFVLRVLV